ncbi:hypothetical protein Nepgr_005161 [Nepenthes gracilis]|uniref:RNA methyltransferase n=1 Tax=Nepenthes gracilis TaxID=150966 RepID=A0AAD3S2N3_NEPGR|nr:hypothetical protein Nepgr_005161 [Nepenthes gracilis]
MPQIAGKSGNQISCCSEDAEGAKNKRKRKEFAPFGNYRNYYGYRVGRDIEEDPRFKLLKKDWFEGKNCLDIGCNNGLITISIARKFRCHTILGIDIDRDRIEDARWNLRKIVKKESATKGYSSKVKLLEVANRLEHAESLCKNEDQMRGKTYHSSEERSLYDIVSFRCENFIENCRPSLVEHYDTIVCLSVTKWVQLNWGDEGLIKLFAKIWRLLHPGGILVLEPQPWKSYCSKRLVTETTAINFEEIKLYPKCFQEILIDKIGFRTVEIATSNLSSTAAGFNRPILLSGDAAGICGELCIFNGAARAIFFCLGQII